MKSFLSVLTLTKIFIVLFIGFFSRLIDNVFVAYRYGLKHIKSSHIQFLIEGKSRLSHSIYYHKKKQGFAYEHVIDLRINTFE